MPSYSPFAALAQSGVTQAPTAFPDTMGVYDPNNSFTTPYATPGNPLAPKMSMAEQLRLEILHPSSNGHWVQDQQNALPPANANEPVSWKDIGVNIPLPSPAPPAPPADYANMGQSMAVGPNTQPDALAMNAEQAYIDGFPNAPDPKPDAMSIGTASSGEQLAAPAAAAGGSNLQAMQAIGQGLQSANQAGGTGAKIGGVIGTGAGAAIGGPVGAAIGSAGGQLIGSVVDWYADQNDAQARENAKKLAQQKADKYEAMQMAEYNKKLEEANQNREFALGDREHALDLQRKKEMAIAAEQTFKIQQAKQTQRGLTGFGTNELSLMGANPLAQTRNYQ